MKHGTGIPTENYEVTLILTLPSGLPYGSHAHPADWNWRELLDLHPHEGCVVVTGATRRQLLHSERRLLLAISNVMTDAQLDTPIPSIRGLTARQLYQRTLAGDRWTDEP